MNYKIAGTACQQAIECIQTCGKEVFGRLHAMRVEDRRGLQVFLHENIE